MTKEKAAKLWPLIKQWCEGGVLQCRRPTGWVTLNYPLFDEDIENYRIKPTPKLRPWRPEEVPVGCLLRCSSWPKGNAIVLFESINDSVFLPNFGSPMHKKLHELLSTYEHSLDHGKTWLPCGVMEET